MVEYNPVVVERRIENQLMKSAEDILDCVLKGKDMKPDVCFLITS